MTHIRRIDLSERTPAHRLDAQGIADRGQRPLEPDHRAARRAGRCPGRRTADQGRRAAGRHRQVHRAQRQGQVRRPRRDDRRDDQLGQDQPADDGRALGEPQGRLHGRAQGSGRAVRCRPVRRQPARISRQRPRHHADGVAQPVHPHAAGAAEGRRTGRLRRRNIRSSTCRASRPTRSVTAAAATRSSRSISPRS